MYKKLLKLLNNSYSPYSKFRVASITVMKDGKEFVGSNAENASICSECSAIISAISNSYKKFLVSELCSYPLYEGDLK